jgi:hypothetical protein
MSHGYYTFPGEIHKKIFAVQEPAALALLPEYAWTIPVVLKLSKVKIVVDLKELDRYSCNGWSGSKKMPVPA